MADNEKIPMTPEERQEAVQVIQKLHSQTGFLAELLGMDAVGRSEAETHMSLMRHSYDDLAALLRTDTISTDLDRTHALCREANARVHELEQQLGRETTAEAAVQKIKLLDRWFGTWWELSGFKYLSTQWAPWCITFETSDDIDHKSDTGHDLIHGDQLLALKVAPVVPYLFDGMDVRKDTFHDELLLTDRNVRILREKFTAVFPGARLNKIEAHADGDNILLRVKGSVPWTDIEAWHDRALAEASGLTDRPTGKLFAELYKLEERLADDRYKKDCPKDILLQDRQRLNWLRTVCGLYKSIMDAKPGTILSLRWALDGKAHSRRFGPVDPRNNAEDWLSKEFSVDVLHDLKGDDADA